VILFGVFVRTEKRHKEPLLDLHLLQDRSRLGGLAVMALIVGVHFAVLFILVQYLQRILGYTPLVAGLAYMPLTATVFAISQFVPRLIRRFGMRVLLVTGSVLVAVSLLGFVLLGEHSAYFPGVLIPLCMPWASLSSSRQGPWRSCTACPTRMPALRRGCCRWTSRSAARWESR